MIFQLTIFQLQFPMIFHFTVEVANWVSKYTNISCGIPLGSIWGPLLVLIYVGDISQAVESNLNLYLYLIPVSSSIIRRSLKYEQWTNYTFRGEQNEVNFLILDVIYN